MEEEFMIPQEAYERLSDPDLLAQQISEGKTFQEIIGYESETMNQFYSAACSLYEKQEYQKSSEAFSFLTTINPYVHSYWVGLGMAEQLRGKYEDSLLAYAMAVLTQIEDPIPHYHSATCYRELGELDQAIDSLEVAIQYANDLEEHADLKERATAVKKRWENLKRR